MNPIRLFALFLILALGAFSCSNDDDDDGGTSNDDDSHANDDDDMSDECGGATCGENEACIDERCSYVNSAGCNPIGLTDRDCYLPWPSNYYTRPDDDPENPNGIKLDYSADLLPINAQGLKVPVEELFNVLNGFSVNSQIRFLFPAGVDPVNLPPVDAPGESLEEDSPTVLLNADTGQRWIHFSEVDATAEDPNRQIVFVRPMKRLAFASRYIVAVRGLKDRDGDPIEASPAFLALRDGLETDSEEIEALRESYEEIFDILEDNGIDRGDLQSAWDFTTVTRELMTRDIAAVVADAKGRVENGDLGYTIESITEDTHPNMKWVIRGRYNVPSYMTGDALPGDTWNRGEDGLPTFNKIVDAPFVIGVPKTVWDAGQPVPSFLWGHGLFGSGEQVQSPVREFGTYIGAGTDIWGMSTEDVLFIGGVLLGQNLKNGWAVPHRLLQATINYMTLGYLMTGEMAFDPALGKDGASLIDTERLYYMGSSQGGIMGGTIMTALPNVDRGLLNVGSGVYSMIVWRSRDWTPYNGMWSATQYDWMDREFLMSLYQSIFDFSDPGIFAETLFEDPFAHNSIKRTILISSLGDDEVANVGSEMLARTYNMEMSAPPLFDVAGIPNNYDPIEGNAYLQVDTLKAPPPPLENIPPDDNGAHGAAYDAEVVREMIRTFLEEGVFPHDCDGPCDPD